MRQPSSVPSKCSATQVGSGLDARHTLCSLFSTDEGVLEMVYVKFNVVVYRDGWAVGRLHDVISTLR